MVDLTSPQAQPECVDVKPSDPSPTGRRCRQADEGEAFHSEAVWQFAARFPHPALRATFSREEKEKPAEFFG
jgi:hypothetical protein